MLNKNDVVTLEITALTNEGSGVGHYGADEQPRHGGFRSVYGGGGRYLLPDSQGAEKLRLRALGSNSDRFSGPR